MTEKDLEITSKYHPPGKNTEDPDSKERLALRRILCEISKWLEIQSVECLSDISVDANTIRFVREEIKSISKKFGVDLEALRKKTQK